MVHFPAKEHVVVEVERAEEAKIVARLGTRQPEPTDLVSIPSLLVREVLTPERRLILCSFGTCEISLLTNREHLHARLDRPFDVEELTVGLSNEAFLAAHTQ